MGSAPASLSFRLPSSGVVPSNAAIVLEGRIFDPLVVTASMGVTVAIDTSLPIGGGQHTYWLLRPTSGEWPKNVTLTAVAGAVSATLEVPVGARDEEPPKFSWLAPPDEGTTLTPWSHRQYLQFEHGRFEDAAGPFVIVDLELADGRPQRIVLEEGRSGSFHVDRATCRQVDALALTDLAGNRGRTLHPTLHAIPARPMPDLTDRGKGSFRYIAGTLEAVNTLGAFIATSDASTNGFSRGHFVSLRDAHGDVDISVNVRRLTTDVEMPIEIMFRGGFFGVTSNGQWYLYEHDGHWTGWKQPPSALTKVSALRVVQRGQHITGYIDNHVVGDFTLEQTPSASQVGIAFKGRPGERAQIRFHDFFVKAPD